MAGALIASALADGDRRVAATAIGRSVAAFVGDNPARALIGFDERRFEPAGIASTPDRQSRRASGLSVAGKKAREFPVRSEDVPGQPLVKKVEQRN